MKTLAKTFAAAVMITISTLSMASTKPEKELNLSTATLAIDTYMEAMTEGQSEHLEQLFAADFSQKVQNRNTRTNNRSEVIKFLKKQKGEKLNCKTSSEIIEQNADYAVAKIVMQFDGFSKTDYITLVKEGELWKVSSSVHSYQD